MSDYLFNVLLSALPYILIGLVLYHISLLIPAPPQAVPNHGCSSESTPGFFSRHKKTFKAAGLFIAAAGILYGAVSPTNTPKNQLDVDRVAENAAITKEILEKETGPIQDIAAKPELSAEERKQKFDELVDRRRFLKDAQPE